MSKESFVDQQYSTYLAKNTLYGNSFTETIERFGNVAMGVRCFDKIQRIRQLTSGQDFTSELEIVNDEKLEDSVRDLFNYVCMYLAMRSCTDVKTIMEIVIDDPIQIFLYLSLPYGEFKNPVLNSNEPKDIELFRKIEDILIFLTK